MKLTGLQLSDNKKPENKVKAKRKIKKLPKDKLKAVSGVFIAKELN